MSDLTMDAILANVFLTVQTQLATIPDLKFIDQDLGQLDFDDELDKSPVKFPCALFDMVDIQYTDNAEDSQLATAILELRLGLTAYAAATHYYQNNSHKENALFYFNLEHTVNKALHGWSDDMYFNPLSRISAQTEKRKDNIRVRVLRYAFGFTDNTAMPVYTQLTRPDLEIDIS
jgi:hypothetical protein